MKAAVYYQNGGPEVLKYEDVPDPVCHPKGVVIRVEAVSIEGGDTLNRWHGPLLSKPHVVGYQAGGEIVEVGSEVTDLKVGQKVTTVNAMGSHAALRSVPALITEAAVRTRIPASRSVGSGTSLTRIPRLSLITCFIVSGSLLAPRKLVVHADRQTRRDLQRPRLVRNLDTQRRGVSSFGALPSRFSVTA